ncbi:MAG: hypothetical protein JSV49_07395 [Thermoplasmata archaeon]|nr:MAG: hypothetical protein JSV49_07395 [Thermoplasmata archaeon]
MEKKSEPTRLDKFYKFAIPFMLIYQCVLVNIAIWGVVLDRTTETYHFITAWMLMLFIIFLTILAGILTYDLWKNKVKNKKLKEDLHSTFVGIFALGILFFGLIFANYMVFTTIILDLYEPEDTYTPKEFHVDFEIDESVDFFNITITGNFEEGYNDSLDKFDYHFYILNNSEYPEGYETDDYYETRHFDELEHNKSDFVEFIDADGNSRLTKNDRIIISRNYNGSDESYLFLYIALYYHNDADDVSYYLFGIREDKIENGYLIIKP